MKVVVIGGGPAGMAAASRVRRLQPESEITVVERTRFVSFALCGTPYYVGDVVKSLDDLMYYPPKYFVEKRRINLMLNSVAESISIEDKKVFVRSGDEVKELEWDKLIVATGARATVPPIPGVDLEGVFTLHHLDEAHELKEALKKAKDVLIVGAGLVGMELAENVKRLGKEVKVVEMFDHVLPKSLDSDIAEKLELPVEVYTGVKIEEIRRSNGRLAALAGDERFEADLIIMATGIRPNTELLREIGQVGETGALKVDERMRLPGRSDVYAAGDAVETRNLVTGRPDWFPFAQVANKMGLVAGANAAGYEIAFPGAVGTWTTEVFGVEIAGTGLTESRARELGYEVVSSLIEAGDRAHYIPGRSKIIVKMVAEKGGRVLGVQAIGKGALHRVNVAASLIARGADPHEFIFTDMGYAPPLAPVWDPLIIAARRLSPIL